MFALIDFESAEAKAAGTLLLENTPKGENQRNPYKVTEPKRKSYEDRKRQIDRVSQERTHTHTQHIYKPLYAFACFLLLALTSTPPTLNPAA